MNGKKRVGCSLLFAVVCSLLLVPSCKESRRGGWGQDWQALYGERWPLTRLEGAFHCTVFFGKVQSVAFWSGGYEYYLIPMVKEGDDRRPIDLIVKPDPKNPGKKMDTGLVLEEGLKWCHLGVKF